MVRHAPGAAQADVHVRGRRSRGGLRALPGLAPHPGRDRPAADVPGPVTAMILALPFPDAVFQWLMILGIVVAVNVVPLIMPPTWVVLAFFHFRWDLAVLPLAFFGALGAVTGRGLLALLSRQFGM